MRGDNLDESVAVDVRGDDAVAGRGLRKAGQGLKCKIPFPVVDECAGLECGRLELLGVGEALLCVNLRENGGREGAVGGKLCAEHRHAVRAAALAADRHEAAFLVLLGLDESLAAVALHVAVIEQ